MLRFTPPGHHRFEQATSLELWTAGAELNVAVALARLGARAAWVSRLPDNALGRFVLGQARANGVGVDGVQLCEEGRLGLLFVEVGQLPRASATLYDRADSAFALLAPEAFDWPALLAGASAFHTTGITPALSAACARATEQALIAAHDRGCHTSFDLNFRSRLTSPGEASATVESLAGAIDTLIASAGEAEAVFGLTGDPAEVAAELRARLEIHRVVVSSRVPTGENTQLRRSACVDDEVIEVESPEFRTVDPLGGGDAFSAGLLCGLLTAGPHRGLELGGAAAALKQSIPGDFAVFSSDDVEHLLQRGAFQGTRR